VQIPFITALSPAKTVLIAGAGGGFDVAHGIPLYLWLRSLGKQVVLANLSFSALSFTENVEICPDTYQITENSAEVDYFPEKRILEWLRDRNESPAIYGFSCKMGVAPLRRAYAEIIARHAVDSIVLIDGGTDSLMTGNEHQVGSIVEDACSIVAVAGLPLENCFLAAIGFGVERNLEHYGCLENMAALARRGHFLGALSLTGDMAEGEAYLELVDHLNKTISFHPSIVANNIASAIRGQFGDFHATWRTRDSDQFISPLMNLYWFFRLQGIATRIQFAEKIEKTETMSEVANIFRVYRASTSRRAHRPIPLK
jgi:hypothetical protein